MLESAEEGGWGAVDGHKGGLGSQPGLYKRAGRRCDPWIVVSAFREG